MPLRKQSTNPPTIYLARNISSLEIDVIIRKEKAWAAIDLSGI